MPVLDCLFHRQIKKTTNALKTNERYVENLHHLSSTLQRLHLKMEACHILTIAAQKLRSPPTPKMHCTFVMLILSFVKVRLHNTPPSEVEVSQFLIIIGHLNSSISVTVTTAPPINSCNYNAFYTVY